MRHVFSRALLGVCLLTRIGLSAPPLGPESRYERILCVVPMTGSGTYTDPRRPMFAPAGPLPLPDTSSKSLGFRETPRILAYHSVLSDDGQSAIVEFVARDRAAFKQIMDADRSVVSLFERGKISRPALLDQLRKVKKDFTLESLQVGAQ